MEWDRDRKLDVVGAVLALVVVASVALLAHSALVADSSGPAEPPAANWTVERVNDSHVELRHTGGTAVSSEALLVTVNGRERPTPFDGIVQSDDSATLRVGAGRTVRIYWLDEGNTRQLLHEADA